ncbi:MAG: ThuA domain-containing protein [Planctomycetes bacterium]|nr:ThuA domain-containing protein [Planctomycetota bacterium]
MVVPTMLAFTPFHSAAAADLWVTHDGYDGPGRGKHVVLVSGDEEYRSEEALPQLGRILARHHGFKCTVLFAVDPKDGRINPQVVDNIPGLEALKTADLMIIATRFRDLPDEQMKYIVDYVESGKPIIGMRTATHAFKIAKGKTYDRYSFDSKQEGWVGGFGRRILGETWISHHGHHGKQSSRGVIAPDMKDHPIVRGCQDIWGPTDVYTVRSPLPDDGKALVLGEVLEGMKPTDQPVSGEQNDPMMPVAWIKTYRGTVAQPPPTGKSVAQPPSAGNRRVFTITMGAATDLESEGLRRLLVNATYWCLGMEDKIPPKANVDIVGQYHPSPFGFAGHKKGVKPAELSDVASQPSAGGK